MGGGGPASFDKAITRLVKEKSSLAEKLPSLFPAREFLAFYPGRFLIRRLGGRGSLCPSFLGRPRPPAAIGVGEKALSFLVGQGKVEVFYFRLAGERKKSHWLSS